MKELSLHILDIVHNSISAKATDIEIKIIEQAEINSYILQVKDNGKGIDPQKISTITDPFVTSRKSRKVGMGLSLLKQRAEGTGGYLSIHSQPGQGTNVEVRFGLDHMDRPPIGQISSTIISLVTSHPDIRFKYHHITQNGIYIFDTLEILETLDGISLHQPDIRRFLLEMLEENLSAIKIIR